MVRQAEPDLSDPQALDGKGMLRSRLEPSPKGPKRRVYTRTEKGRAELLQWLDRVPVVGSERFAYLAQIYFMDGTAGPSRP